MGCLTSKNHYETLRSSINFSSERKASTSPIVQCHSAMNLFITNKDRVNILNNPNMSMPTKLLLNPPFCNMSCFNSHLYLTGLSGLTIDNLKSSFVKYLINVAEEIPMMNCGSNTIIVNEKFPVSFLKLRLQPTFFFVLTNFFLLDCGKLQFSNF